MMATTIYDNRTFANEGDEPRRAALMFSALRSKIDVLRQRIRKPLLRAFRAKNSTNTKWTLETQEHLFSFAAIPVATSK